MRVRDATEQDVPSIASSAVALGQEAIRHDPPNRDHINNVVSALIAHEDGLACVLESNAGHYAGCYLGTLYPNQLSGKRVAIEILFWVNRTFRGHGKRLLDFAEKWAREHGCEANYLSHPIGMARVGSTFEAWGYEVTELHYRKPLQ